MTYFGHKYPPDTFGRHEVIRGIILGRIFYFATPVTGTRKVIDSGFYWSERWWGGSGISWNICKSFASRSRQTTTPIPHHSVFYRPDALPDTQPTASKDWRQLK